MRRTTITLTDDLAELVEHEARRRGSSVSEVIRQSLAVRFLEKTRRLSFVGICDDAALVRGADIEQALQGWDDDLDGRRR